MSENKINNNMGLAIAMGAGIGLVFGQFIFDDVGIGLSVGAGLGVVYGSINKFKKNKSDDNQ
ncbi:hypothetical protein [Pseudoalteromonas sp. MMG022]|uniref:hypothetical protein n=1 Tax=Pseudoalteromonas sp. MMG022 TaxID=2909978 RepID=UPI001F31D967|nr:hypothetical protein [Pseudoalteromonas sp. MMG022]MCF6437787.1 hypothetical protein [Pseudoalteromonas sp. MMG022]